MSVDRPLTPYFLLLQISTRGTRSTSDFTERKNFWSPRKANSWLLTLNQVDWYRLWRMFPLCTRTK